MSFFLLSLLGTLIISLVLRYFSKSSNSLPLPPGPRGNVISGVKRLLPASEPWKVYAEWAEKYGGKNSQLCCQSMLTPRIGSLLFFRVYNRQTIILNNANAVRDLFERRANIYSDRPRSWMFHEICGRKNTVFNISSLNARHKQYRRILQSGLGSQATQDYWPLLDEAIADLLDGLSTSPEKYERHIRRSVKRWYFSHTK